MAARPKKKVSPKRPRRIRSHLVQWGRDQRERGVHWMPTALAQFVAHMADELAPFRDAVDTGQFQGMGKLESIEKWEELYRRPDRMLQLLGDRLKGAEDDLLPGVELGSFARSSAHLQRFVDKHSPEVVKSLIVQALEECDLQELLREARAFHDRFWSRFEALLDGTKPDQGVSLSDELACSQEMQFMVKVFWPCVCQYGRNPHVLYLQARQGNLSAIEQLLRIDPRAARIPVIADWIEHWQATRQSENAEIVGNAHKRPKLRRASKRTEKLRAVGMVWHIARRFAPISPVLLSLGDLRQAFDAAARDRGFRCDGDLPASEEAFRKGVGRVAKKEILEAWDIF